MSSKDSNDAELCWFMVIGLAMMAVIIAIPFVGLNCSPGNAVFTGRIIEVKEVGIRWKTWEIRVISGGLQDGSGSFSTIERTFTMDKELASKAMKLADSRIDVRIAYRQKGLYARVRSESDGRFAESIDEVKLR